MASQMAEDSLEATVIAVRIAADDVMIDGNLTLPPDCCGVVIFAASSGSGRFSKHSLQMAEPFHDCGLGTLLIDLLTVEEPSGEAEAHTLLAKRTACTAKWLKDHALLQDMPVGLFGAGMGGAVALVASALMPDAVTAVVAHGGCPDAASGYLSGIRAPTLMLCAESDPVALARNNDAQARIAAVTRVSVVPDGLGDRAITCLATVAADWFRGHFLKKGVTRPPGGHALSGTTPGDS